MFNKLKMFQPKSALWICDEKPRKNLFSELSSKRLLWQRNPRSQALSWPFSVVGSIFKPKISKWHIRHKPPFFFSALAAFIESLQIIKPIFVIKAWAQKALGKHVRITRSFETFTRNKIVIILHTIISDPNTSQKPWIRKL